MYCMASLFLQEVEDAPEEATGKSAPAHNERVHAHPVMHCCLDTSAGGGEGGGARGGGCWECTCSKGRVGLQEAEDGNGG